jgi:hypothetical protein
MAHWNPSLELTLPHVPAMEFRQSIIILILIYASGVECYQSIGMCPLEWTHSDSTSE